MSSIARLSSSLPSAYRLPLDCAYEYVEPTIDILALESLGCDSFQNMECEYFCPMESEILKLLQFLLRTPTMQIKKGIHVEWIFFICRIRFVWLALVPGGVVAVGFDDVACLWD